MARLYAHHYYTARYIVLCFNPLVLGDPSVFHCGAMQAVILCGVRCGRKPAGLLPKQACLNVLTGAFRWLD